MSLDDFDNLPVVVEARRSVRVDCADSIARQVSRIVYPIVAIVAGGIWLALGSEAARATFAFASVLAYTEALVIFFRRRARRRLRAQMKRVWDAVITATAKEAVEKLLPTARNGVIHLDRARLKVEWKKELESIATMQAVVSIIDRPTVPRSFFVEITDKLETILVALEGKRPALVRSLPLCRLDRLARFLWSTKTYQLVFEPARADIIHEWNDAAMRGEKWRARYINFVRGPWTMLAHMAARLPFSIKDRVLAWLRGK